MYLFYWAAMVFSIMCSVVTIILGFGFIDAQVLPKNDIAGIILIITGIIPLIFYGIIGHKIIYEHDITEESN